jgi:ankyrin repeat protein
VVGCAPGARKRNRNTMPTYTADNWYEAERLHRAAREGDLKEMVRLVEQGFDTNMFDDRCCTPLHCAVEGEQYTAVEWLLLHGADVDANDEAMIGETALSIAVQRNRSDIVELLLRHHANPDINGWMGRTARSRASRRNDEDGKRNRDLIERHAPTMEHQR